MLSSQYFYGQLPSMYKSRDHDVMSFYNVQQSVDISKESDQNIYEPFNPFIRYLTSYIDFYTIFNFDAAFDPIELEFGQLGYKAFNKFTAPKKIKTISFYNYFIENDEAKKYTYYYDKKENLIQKEVVEVTKISDNSNKKIEDVFYYQYEDLKDSFNIKKFKQEKEDLFLWTEYTFSKDKRKLLEIIFHNNRVYNIKNIEFSYDTVGNIKDITSHSRNTYEYKAKVIDLNTEQYKYTHPCFTKDFWVNTGKEDNIGIPNIGNNFYDFKKEELIGNNKVIEFYHSGKEILRIECDIISTNSLVYSDSRIYYNANSNPSYNHSGPYGSVYNGQSFYRIDGNLNLSFALLIERSKENNRYTNRDTPNFMFFFIRDANKNDQFYVKHIITKQSYIPDRYTARMVMVEDNIPAIANLNYIIKLKKRKGLNEIYIFHDNKKYPLLTIE